MFGGMLAPFAWFVWEGFAPSKAKFFAWLLIQSRIQSRAALLKKQVLSARSAGVTARRRPPHSQLPLRLQLLGLDRVAAHAGRRCAPPAFLRHAPGVRLGHGIDFHDTLLLEYLETPKWCGFQR
jgi:hypothetical protein